MIPIGSVYIDLNRENFEDVLITMDIFYDSPQRLINPRGILINACPP